MPTNKVDLDVTNNRDASVLMTRIFGQGGVPELGDDYVCQMLCACYGTKSCPFFGKESRYIAGLCSQFVEADPTHRASLLHDCLDHYPGHMVSKLRRSGTR